MTVHFNKCSYLCQVNIFTVTKGDYFIKCKYKLEGIFKYIFFFKYFAIFRNLKKVLNLVSRSSKNIYMCYIHYKDIASNFKIRKRMKPFLSFSLFQQFFMIFRDVLVHIYRLSKINFILESTYHS